MIREISGCRVGVLFERRNEAMVGPCMIKEGAQSSGLQLGTSFLRRTVTLRVESEQRMRGLGRAIPVMRRCTNVHRRDNYVHSCDLCLHWGNKGSALVQEDNTDDSVTFGTMREVKAGKTMKDLPTKRLRIVCCPPSSSILGRRVATWNMSS